MTAAFMATVEQKLIIYKPKTVEKLDFSPIRFQPEEVLLAAESDDDSLPRREWKKRRRQAAAEHYLRYDIPPYISSARFYGPFKTRNPSNLGLGEERLSPTELKAGSQTHNSQGQTHRKWPAPSPHQAEAVEPGLAESSCWVAHTHVPALNSCLLETPPHLTKAAKMWSSAQGAGSKKRKHGSASREQLQKRPKEKHKRSLVGTHLQESKQTLKFPPNQCSFESDLQQNDQVPSSNLGVLDEQEAKSLNRAEFLGKSARNAAIKAPRRHLRENLQGLKAQGRINSSPARKIMTATVGVMNRHRLISATGQRSSRKGDNPTKQPVGSAQESNHSQRVNRLLDYSRALVPASSALRIRPCPKNDELSGLGSQHIQAQYRSGRSTELQGKNEVQSEQPCKALGSRNYTKLRIDVLSQLTTPPDSAEESDGSESASPSQFLLLNDTGHEHCSSAANETIDEEEFGAAQPGTASPDSHAVNSPHEPPDEADPCSWSQQQGFLRKEYLLNSSLSSHRAQDLAKHMGMPVGLIRKWFKRYQEQDHRASITRQPRQPRDPSSLSTPSAKLLFENVVGDCKREGRNDSLQGSEADSLRVEEAQGGGEQRESSRIISLGENAVNSFPTPGTYHPVEGKLKRKWRTEYHRLPADDQPATSPFVYQANRPDLRRRKTGKAIQHGLSAVNCPETDSKKTDSQRGLQSEVGVNFHVQEATEIVSLVQTQAMGDMVYPEPSYSTRSIDQCSLSTKQSRVLLAKPTGDIVRSSLSQNQSTPRGIQGAANEKHNGRRLEPGNSAVAAHSGEGNPNSHNGNIIHDGSVPQLPQLDLSGSQHDPFFSLVKDLRSSSQETVQRLGTERLSGLAPYISACGSSTGLSLGSNNADLREAPIKNKSSNINLEVEGDPSNGASDAVPTPLLLSSQSPDPVGLYGGSNCESGVKVQVLLPGSNRPTVKEDCSTDSVTITASTVPRAFGVQSVAIKVPTRKQQSRANAQANQSQYRPQLGTPKNISVHSDCDINLLEALSHDSFKASSQENPTTSILPEAQTNANGLRAFPSRPSTLMLNTEKQALHTTISCEDISTQAAFAQAQADFQSSETSPTNGLRSCGQRTSSMLNDLHSPTPSIDDDTEADLNTQDMLEKAPRYTISPAITRHKAHIEPVMLTSKPSCRPSASPTFVQANPEAEYEQDVEHSEEVVQEEAVDRASKPLT